ncbi:MAG TPA: NHL repeat-containing protein [Solirubrobacterales bacterium]|nr:NHL repeat-containing protein [Solirubrobacterales bacterium]
MRARALAGCLFCALFLAVAIGPATAQGARELLTETAVQTTFCKHKDCDEPTPAELLNPVPPPEGQVEGPCGLAVDAGGRLLLSDYHHNTVNFFAGPELMFSGQTAGGAVPPEGPCGLAAGPGGALYVNVWHQRVVRLEPTVQVFDTDSSTGVVVDPPDVYVADPNAHRVDVYKDSFSPSASRLSYGVFSGEDPQAIAVDQSNGDLYVISSTGDTVSRFNSSGLPKNFTAGPNAGASTLTGFGFTEPTASQIAIDNSGGPADGSIYVTNSQSNKIEIFATDGMPLGALDGSSTPSANFSEPCGVAVDQSSGDLYIGDFFSEQIWRYSPSGGAIEETDYSGGIATSIVPCQMAVSVENLYVAYYANEGPTRKYSTSAFTKAVPFVSGSDFFKGFAVATDPSNGDIYLDRGNQVEVFNSSGSLLYKFGLGDFSASAGVAVRASGDVYVNNRTYVAVYEPSGAPVLDGGEPLKIGLGSLGDGYGVAVSGGRVYVPDAADQTVKVYEPAVDPLVPVAAIGCFNSLVDAAITVDPTNGNLLVVDNLKPGFEHPQAAIFEFDSAGAFLDRFVGPVHGEPSGIVVDPATGVLFVTDGNGELSNVFAYGPFESGGGSELECPLEGEDALGGAGGAQGAGIATGASSVAVARPPTFVGPRRSTKRSRKKARRGRGRVAVGTAVALPGRAHR